MSTVCTWFIRSICNNRLTFVRKTHYSPEFYDKSVPIRRQSIIGLSRGASNSNHHQKKDEKWLYFRSSHSEILIWLDIEIFVRFGYCLRRSLYKINVICHGRHFRWVVKYTNNAVFLPSPLFRYSAKSILWILPVVKVGGSNPNFGTPLSAISSGTATGLIT